MTATSRYFEVKVSLDEFLKWVISNKINLPPGDFILEDVVQSGETFTVILERTE